MWCMQDSAARECPVEYSWRFYELKFTFRKSPQEASSAARGVMAEVVPWLSLALRTVRAVPV